MASSYRKRWNRLNAGYIAELDDDIEEDVHDSDWTAAGGPVAFFKLNYMRENYKRKRFDGTQLDLFKKDVKVK